VFNLQSQINTLNYFKSLHKEIKTRGYKRAVTILKPMKTKKKYISLLQKVRKNKIKSEPRNNYTLKVDDDDSLVEFTPVYSKQTTKKIAVKPKKVAS
jgi:hypothetical protein